MNTAVILGAAVWPGGVPSPTLERRVRAAIALWTRGEVQHVVASGGLGRYPPSEAEVMSGLLQEAGVPPAEITLEDRSTSTYTNALFTLGLVDPADDLVVVTDSYHCLRARMTFRALGRQVRTVSASGTPPHPRRL